MALASQAALLDELMGIDRNSNTKKELTWEDEKVCKYYLAGFCPHDLFVNTKMTLGECPKYHNSKLLDNYKRSPQYMKMGYERRLKKFLQNYVLDVQKKIDYNIDRLRNGLLSGTEVAIKERIKRQEEEVNNLVRMIEEKANEGKIEESSRLSMELEDLQRDLKYDKIELQRQREFSREKMEDVCKICGAYISKTDPRNSMENHITGRIHCSYVKINEIIDMLNRQLRSSSATGAYDDEEDDRLSKHSKTRHDYEEERLSRRSKSRYDSVVPNKYEKRKERYYPEEEFYYESYGSDHRSQRSYEENGEFSPFKKTKHHRHHHHRKRKKPKSQSRSRSPIYEELEDGEY